MSLLLVLIGVIGQWLLGVGCAELLLRRSDADRAARSRFIGVEQVGLGIVLGVAATSGLSLLYSLLGGSLAREWSLTLAALGWIWISIRCPSGKTVSASASSDTACRK